MVTFFFLSLFLFLHLFFTYQLSVSLVMFNIFPYDNEIFYDFMIIYIYWFLIDFFGICEDYQSFEERLNELLPTNDEEMTMISNKMALLFVVIVLFCFFNFIASVFISYKSSCFQNFFFIKYQLRK